MQFGLRTQVRRISMIDYVLFEYYYYQYKLQINIFYIS